MMTVEEYHEAAMMTLREVEKSGDMRERDHILGTAAVYAELAKSAVWPPIVAQSPGFSPTGAPQTIYLNLNDLAKIQANVEHEKIDE